MFMNFLRHGCIEHQIGEDMLCMKLIRPGDLVFDVGANIGYTTLLFASLSTPRGAVVAFEPSPRAFALLQRSIEDVDKIDARNLAVSSLEGEVEFYETESLDTSSIIPTDHVRSYIVRTCTLDAVAQETGIPHFIKIDVEGHEAQVIHGMKMILASQMLPIILFEAASVAALGESCSLISSYAGAAYTFHGITRDGALCGIHETQGMSNYLALPDSREMP